MTVLVDGAEVVGVLKLRDSSLRHSAKMAEDAQPRDHHSDPVHFGRKGHRAGGLQAAREGREDLGPLGQGVAVRFFTQFMKT